MAPIPFRGPARRPKPLTVDETLELFGVSPSVARAAQRILEKDDFAPRHRQEVKTLR